MVDSFGTNLNILICTKPGRDWQSFSSWYSFFQNLPEAKISLLIERNGEVPFQFYQWAKRIKVRSRIFNAYSQDNPTENYIGLLYSAINCGLAATPLLCVTDEVMAVSPLNERTLNSFNSSWFGSQASYITDNLSSTLNSLIVYGIEPPSLPINLIKCAKDCEEITDLVSIDKGVGRWLPTARGCPFSSAGGLYSESITINESKVLDLWRKSVPLYQAIL